MFRSFIEQSIQQRTFPMTIWAGHRTCNLLRTTMSISFSVALWFSQIVTDRNSTTFTMEMNVKLLAGIVKARMVYLPAEATKLSSASSQSPHPLSYPPQACHPWGQRLQLGHAFPNLTLHPSVLEISGSIRALISSTTSL